MSSAEPTPSINRSIAHSNALSAAFPALTERLRRPQPEAARSLHLILAEDDRELSAVLALTLREEGHRVTEVADGHQLAQAIIAATAGTARPVDLVITDFLIPRMTGLGVLQLMRDLPACPPFIVMSAFSERAIQLQAARLGAVGFLDKPFSPRALLDLVHAHLMRTPV